MKTILKQGRGFFERCGRRGALSGMEAFAQQFKPARKLLVGTGGIPVEEFLKTPVSDWLE